MCIRDRVKEGELRYKFKIPPGYEDEKGKIGTQIFGDLIIWKQTIDLSKKLNSDVIFITNDLKEDWCHKDSRNRILSPREELIKELFDESNCQLWMYNQTQFIYKSKEYLKIGFDETKIEEISSVINSRNRENLIYECTICGSVNSKSYEDEALVFDGIEQFNDDNGQDVTIFSATDENECNTCQNITEIKLAVATYNQDGEYAGDFVDLDKGRHIRGPNYVIKFLRNEYELDYSEEPLSLIHI